MRREELANLEPRDIRSDFLIVKGGKGDKDRLIPLTWDIAARLHEFTKDKRPDERVFGLRAPCISMKIKQFAKRAGLHELHTHALQHKFATDLLEAGVNLKVVQRLLWHKTLATTEVYVSLTNGSLFEAVRKLEGHQEVTQTTKSWHQDNKEPPQVFESATELTIRPACFDPLVSPIAHRL